MAAESSLDLLFKIRSDATEFLSDLKKGVLGFRDLSSSAQNLDRVKSVDKKTEQTKKLTDQTSSLVPLIEAAATAYASWAVGSGITETVLAVDAAFRKAEVSSRDTAENIEAIQEAANSIYMDAFTDNVTEAFDVATVAAKKLKLENADVIADISEKAKGLEAVFGDDTTSQFEAAAGLVERFGISAQAAFDFIAKGYQEGLNEGGNFLDSLKEYPTYFSDAKFTAGEMFSILKTGSAGGYLGVDKISDAVKEFGIRFAETGVNMKTAYSSLGLSLSDLQEQVNNGSLRTADVFEIVKQKLAELESDTRKREIGAQVIGTQFEDLTNTVFEQVDLQAAKMSDLEGAADRVRDSQNTLGATFQSVGQTFFATIGQSDELKASYADLAESVENNKDLIIELAKGVADFAAVVVRATTAIGEFLVENKEVVLTLTGLAIVLKGLALVAGLGAMFKTFAGGLKEADTAASGLSKNLAAASGALQSFAVGYTLGTMIYELDAVSSGLATAIDAVAGFFGFGPNAQIADAIRDQSKALDEFNSKKVVAQATPTGPTQEQQAAIGQVKELQREIETLTKTKDKNFQDQLNAEKRYSEETALLSDRTARSKMDAHERALDAAKTSIDEARRLEEEYAQKIIEIRDGLNARYESDEDRLRKIRQRTMSEAEKQADLEKQINEKIAASRQALESGESDKAVELADQAKGLAEGLSSAAKAEQLFQEAAKAGTNAVEDQLSAHEETQQKLQDVITGGDTRIEIQVEVEDAEAQIEKLKQKIEALAATANLKITADGVSAQGYAGGGLVRGIGGPKSDSNLAWLSRGEYVIPAEAVKHYGIQQMEMIRRRVAALVPIPRFADGGLNAGTSAPTGAAPVLGVHQLNIVDQSGSQATLFGSMLDVERTINILKKAKRGL